MDRMLRELDEFAPTALEANPSFLARLARHAIATGARPRRPDLIVLTFENPSPTQRALIHRAFAAPIASSYGATEAGYVFMECERGRLHQVSDCCHVDFLPLARRYGGPRLGRLLVSTLDNPWRALVRFDIGDIARLAAPPGATARARCPCGRTGGFVLEDIEGRVAGITLGADGGPVTPAAIDRALASVPGLVDHRLRQDGPGAVRIAYVLDEAAAGPTRGADRAVRAALRRLYGRSCALEVREVPALPPEPSGKYLRAAPTFAVDVDAFLDDAYRPPAARGG
jgi:phenylacetate-CoA ligase